MDSNSDYEKHFKNALSNYAPVRDKEFSDKLIKADRGLQFPESPKDILEYHGNIDLLELSENEKRWARKSTEELIKRHSARWIWDNKTGLKLGLRYIFRIF